MTHGAATNTMTATATGATDTATFDFNVAGGSPGCAKPHWNVLDLLVVDSRTDAGLRVAAVTNRGRRGRVRRERSAAIPSHGRLRPLI